MTQGLVTTVSMQGPPGPIAASVTNAAALAALPTTTFVPGTQAYVQSLKAPFFLDPTSTATPDNIYVISAQGGGNWVAVDQNEAPNVFGQTTTMGAGVSSPVTFTPAGSITKVRSGTILVTAHMAGTASAGNATVMLTVKRDTTTIAQDNKHLQTGGDAFGCSVTVVDTLTDASPHTYSAVLTSSQGGTFTGITDGESLWAIEQ